MNGMRSVCRKIRHTREGGYPRSLKKNGFYLGNDSVYKPFRDNDHFQRPLKGEKGREIKMKIGLKIVILLLAGLALFAFSANAEEGAWKFIKFNDDIFAYYDAQNIAQLPDGHVKVWMKVMPMPESPSYAKIKEEIRKYGVEEEFRSLHILYEMDCSRNTAAQIEMVCFDKSKGVIKTVQIQSETGEISVPKELVEMVKKEVCK